MIKKLRILGKDWIVEEAEEFGAAGLCLFSMCKILINKNQNLEQKKDTTLHEVIHVISDTIGLDLEERQVHGLAAGLYCAMKENQRLAEWLFNSKGGSK